MKKKVKAEKSAFLGSPAVGEGTSGTSMEVPVVGTPKLSGHQFLQEKKKQRKEEREREKKQTDK